MAIEFLTMAEAREYLGVSKPKMWRLVRDGVLPTYEDATDKRKKLIRKDDLDRLRQPRPRGHA